MTTETNLQETVQELLRQAKAKSDYIVPSHNLALIHPSSCEPNEGVKLADNSSDAVEHWGHDIEQQIDADRSALSLHLGLDHTSPYPITPFAHRQLADRCGIPRKYYQRCEQEAPALLVENVNHWLYSSDKDHLVRTLDGKVRALLSNRYRLIDNLDVANALLETFDREGLQVKTCNVTDSHFYLCALSPHLKRDVTEDDPIQGGIIVKNSEVGDGTFSVQQWLYREVCKNGMVSSSLLRKAHVGGEAKLDEDVSHYLKSETQELRDAALFAQVNDVVHGYMTEGVQFHKTVDQLQAAAGLEITGSIEDVCARTTKKLELTQTEGSELLQSLARGGDFTKWGLANAVTSLAHSTSSYDRNIQLQEAGARVIALTSHDWTELQQVAP